MAPVAFDSAALHERDLHQSPFECQALQVLRHVVAADHVENHVDAAFRCDPRDLGFKILRPVIDRMIGAHFPAERNFVGIACGREYGGAESFRQLDRGESDAARSAMHEKCLALREPRTIEHVVPHRKERLGQTSRLFER